MRLNPFAATAAALLAIVFVGASPRLAVAVETKVLRDQGFVNFNQGESTGTELTSQGRLKVAPTTERLDKSTENVAWRAVVDRFDGAIFYSTGSDGKVFRFKNGQRELWCDISEGQAMSLAIDAVGGVYVGASPGGKIYRVVKQGKPELFFETKEQYIWDMIFDRDGVLYAATGANGKIFRIRGQNNGEVYADTDATNIMSLQFNRDGNLIAAGQGRGLVYLVQSSSRVFVLYASSDDECRALAVNSRGTVYVAVNRAASATPVDRIINPSQGGIAIPAQGVNPMSVAAAAIAAATGAQGAGTSGPTPTSGSYIVEIQPSGFVTTFWQSPEAPIHSLATDPDTDTLLVSAGNKGKVMRVGRDTNYSVVADVQEPVVTSLVSFAGRTFLTTAGKASLYELVSAPTREGVFESRPLNAGSTVRWGNLFFEAEETSTSEITFETRTGNTPTPDEKNWSAWEAADKRGGRIAEVSSPVAQYVQYRVRLKGQRGTDGPILDGVQIFYMQQNAAPVVKDVRLEKVGGEAAVSGPPANVTDLLARLTAARAESGGAAAGGGGAAGNAPAAQGSGAQGNQAATPASTPSVGTLTNSQKYTVTWDASDPNGDRLRYRILFKGEDENQWLELDKNLTANRYTFSTEAVPDGRYRIKIEANDSAQNPETSSTTATFISRVMTVDNTNPVITDLKGNRVGDGVWEVTAKASDATSIVAAADYNVDAGKEWRVVFPEDGIFDSSSETFRFRVVPEEDSPEHIVSLRVYDREGNSHVMKIVLTSAGGN